MNARHPEDHTLYQRLLESTRAVDGVENRDHAVKLLAEKLATDAERAEEYALSRAQQVADGFDASHKPETENGQMALTDDSYLVIGKSERVRVDRAASKHTRQWLDILADNHAKVSAAWAAKDQYGRRLLAIQDEHNCSMWDAEKRLRNGGSK